MLELAHKIRAGDLRHTRHCVPTVVVSNNRSYYTERRRTTFCLFLSGVYLSTTEILNRISFAANIRSYAPTLSKILGLTVINSLCFCCRIYIMIGIAAAVFVSIPLCIVCCLFCSICPAYKYRKKRGAVYGASKYTTETVMPLDSGTPS